MGRQKKLRKKFKGFWQPLQRLPKEAVNFSRQGIRWKKTVSNMEWEIEELVRNVFLSATCISYFDVFTGFYRQKLVSKWLENAKSIHVSDKFDIIIIMEDPFIIRGLNISSLTTDQVSIENAILASQAQS